MGPRTALALLVTALALTVPACSSSPPDAGNPASPAAPTPESFALDADSAGYAEFIDNIYNTSIVSNDPNVYKAEYEAGFVQGHLQKEQIPAARDNYWDGTYRTDPSHTFPSRLPVPEEQLEQTREILQRNWDYTMDYIGNTASGKVKKNLRRLLYRLVGIYDGATQTQARAIPFDDTWIPEFDDSEMQVTYETPAPTFMDLYYLNSTGDLANFLPPQPGPSGKTPAAPAPDGKQTSSRCTAFVKVTPDDIFLTHNTWAPFLDQSQATQLWVNGDFMSVNAYDPGYLGSGTDFGYNNKGLIFNETTEDNDVTRAKVESVWTNWRETMAEQYAGSIDEFFEFISIEQSGSYMNGYMIVDAKRDDIGYTEMSWNTTVFYRPDGKGGMDVTTKPKGIPTAYDKKMITPEYMLGFNYPASYYLRKQLQAVNNRPAREQQLLAGIGDVVDIESAKNLITHTAADNPLSIYGRWDLGYGVTTTPQTVPDGSIDAKAVSASQVQQAFALQGVLDPQSDQKAFWMKFGTPTVNGTPFIWSQSQWKEQKLRFVPDVVAGDWQFLDTNIR